MRTTSEEIIICTVISTPDSTCAPQLGLYGVHPAALKKLGCRHRKIQMSEPKPRKKKLIPRDLTSNISTRLNLGPSRTDKQDPFSQEGTILQLGNIWVYCDVLFNHLQVNQIFSIHSRFHQRCLKCVFNKASGHLTTTKRLSVRQAGSSLSHHILVMFKFTHL